MALNADNETFVVHIAALAKPTVMLIYFFCQAQIALLMNEKTGIFTEYSDISDIFSLDSMADLPKHNKINDHLINLPDDKQSLYSLIYSLGLVELEKLKTYIKANLASSFIRPFKFPFDTLILFVQKKDGSLRLYIDYQGLNNLIIKNCYPVPLISESFNYLDRANCFTQMDLLNAYY